jgi:uncharacterized membrane protein YgcG
MAPRRAVTVLVAILVAAAWAIFAAAVAASGPTRPASIAADFPAPVAGQAAYDPQHVLKPSTLSSIESAADGVATTTRLQLVVYVERAAPGLSATQAVGNADALVKQWAIKRGGVLLLDVAANGCGGFATARRGTGIDPSAAPDARLTQVQSAASSFLSACDPDTAALVGLSNLTVAMINAVNGGPATDPGASGAVPSVAPRPTTRPTASGPTNSTSGVPAGPPFPDPIAGQYVYDQARVWKPETIAQVQATIQAIRDRTGAEIAVYSQVKGPDVTEDEAMSDAQALMDQWGVGRRGFDDGLVILFDLDPSRVHGQVQLYAGPGYRAAFLSNEERQSIFDNDMLPLLKEGDLDGALLAAMQKVDANATPEHAAELDRARQINAIVGLVGAPIVLLLLLAWPTIHWLRFGRDPNYLDDPSILMPSPPDDLTAAAGALVYDGKSSRHTLTTALLDLASRDEIAFRPEPHHFGRDKLGIEVRAANGTDPQIALNRRRPISPAETYARDELSGLATTSDTGTEMVDSTALLGLGKDVPEFDKRLEAYVVQKGWFSQPPTKVIGRWFGQGLLEAIGGGALIIIALNLPSDGLTLLGAAVLVAGIVTIFISRAMPARTMPGAMIKAMLSAYRRTLEKTLAMSRSMDQVVASRAVPWLETPDQAVVWGVALGLRGDVENVLMRTATDLEHGRAAVGSTYLPRWYGAPGLYGTGGGPGGGGIAPGLFSGSAIPNFGSMMAAIGTVGNSPSSSGGGFGGGGSGGGGGGAGGGF